MEPAPKSYKKWLVIACLLAAAMFAMHLKINLEERFARPAFHELFSQHSQSHIADIKAYAYQLYSVMIEEVQNDKHGFIITIIIGFLAMVILVMQIIIAITRLPPGYLLRPDSYVVVKKTAEINTSTNHERSST